MLLKDELLAILRQCGAPKHWGLAEVSLIARWLYFPWCIDAVTITRTEGGQKVTVDGMDSMLEGVCSRKYDEERFADALFFARLFSEGLWALVKALPKILQHIQRLSPKRRAELTLAICHLSGHDEVVHWFFEEKADAVAFAYRKLHITAKQVEWIRRSIRKKLSSAA